VRATWMCLWRCMRGISVVLGLFFKWVIEESRTKTMAEIDKKAYESLLLFLRVYMADVQTGPEIRTEGEMWEKCGNAKGYMRRVVDSLMLVQCIVLMGVVCRWVAVLGC